MKQNTPVNYMQLSRDYYAAHGYSKPYQWARFDAIPLTPLKKPLAESTVTIVTTSMPDASYAKNKRRFYIGDLANPPQRLFNDDLFWDKNATHTDDRNSYFPVEELARCVEAGKVGRLAQHFYGVSTDYSHRRTMTRAAPAVLESCQQNGVDVALLVPL